MKNNQDIIELFHISGQAGVAMSSLYMVFRQ